MRVLVYLGLKVREPCGLSKFQKKAVVKKKISCVRDIRRGSDCT